MERAWEMQREIFRAVKASVRAGMSEAQVAAVIDRCGYPWQGDLLSGERTAEVEGSFTDRILQPGDPLLLDLQLWDGRCWSDITRTFFVEWVSDPARRAFEAVSAAIGTAEKRLAPGVTGEELFDTLQAALPEEGRFSHHGGHLIGAEPLEQPQFYPGATEPLPIGTRITLEPGLYFPGRFGIRLENNYEITEQGFLPLFSDLLPIDEYLLKGI